MITRRTAFTATLALAGGAVVAEAAKTKKLSKKDLKTLISSAKSRADHQRLADYYSALAVEYDAESKEHTAEAEAYAKNPTIQESKNPGGGRTAGHCRFFATKYAEMAETAKEMATIHSDMAKGAQ